MEFNKRLAFIDSNSRDITDHLLNSDEDTDDIYSSVDNDNISQNGLIHLEEK